MTNLYTARNAARASKVQHDFGVTDRLGRMMGIYTVAFQYDEPAQFFGYETQTTRNGQDKQASHGQYKFTTAAERDAAMAKAVAAARKRALAPAARLTA